MSGSRVNHTDSVSASSHRTTSPGSFRRLDPSAKETLGQHLIEWLATLVLPDLPQSISEVDARLADGLTTIPDKLMPNPSDAEKYRLWAEKRRRKELVLPVDKVYSALKEFNGRFSLTVCTYIVAVAEHILVRFLMAAISFEERTIRQNVIRGSTVKTLSDAYRSKYEHRSRAVGHRLPTRFPQDYDKCVEELYTFLHHSVEQLNLLLRVFREPLVTLVSSCASCNARGTSSTTTYTTSNQDQATSAAICCSCSSSGCGVTDQAHVIFASLLDVHNNLRILLDNLESEEEEVVGDEHPSGVVVGTLDEEGSSSTSANTPASAQPASAGAATHPNLHRGRLLGVCLIEMAEYDSLHVFSQYASAVVDSAGRDLAWCISTGSGAGRGDTDGMVPLLCRFSRTILNTTAASITSAKIAINNGFMETADSRSVDLHSFLCSRCLYWDSVATKQRRRSFSSNTLRTSHQTLRISPTPEYQRQVNNHSAAPTVPDFPSSSGQRPPMTPHKVHRASHSSASEAHVSSAACNFLVNCFKYLLPRLLLLPIFHFYHLHELLEALHRYTYDDDDRARLAEVLSMLSKTRASLERERLRHPWMAVHLDRLFSTAHLPGRYRPLYLDLFSGASPSQLHSSSSSPAVSPGAGDTGPGREEVATTPSSSGEVTPAAATDQVAGATASLASSPTHYASQLHSCSKVEELERLLGGRDKLIASCSPWNDTLGDFVMEGRVRLYIGYKPTSSEHIAYLFTTHLLICKWQEPRRTPLNPSANQPTVLRVKRCIPLDAIHLVDLPPVVQPNLSAYIGNSGCVRSSAVGAAVWAATNAASSASADDEKTSTLSTTTLYSGFSGSVLSQSSLLSTIGGSGVTAYPYLFELTFLHVKSHSASYPSTHHGSSQQHQHYQQHSSPAGSSAAANCPPGGCGGAGFHRPACYQTRQSSPPRPGEHSGDCSAGLGLLSHVSLPNMSPFAPATGGPMDHHLATSSTLTSTSSSGNCWSASCSLPPGCQVQHVWLALRTPEEKADWMATLLSIQNRRLFLRYVRTLPRLEIPLRLPSPSIYRFTTPDSPSNIEFETTRINGTLDMNAVGSRIDLPLPPDSIESSDDGLAEEDCLTSDSVDLLDESLGTNLESLFLSTNTSKVSGEASRLSPVARIPCDPIPPPGQDGGGIGCRDHSEVPPVGVPGPSSPRQTGVPAGALSAGYPPQIRYATLEKLVERMTYPTYFDSKLVNTFLLVFRRVTTPAALLDLLIERFRVPDPEFLPEEMVVDSERGQLESPADHMLKRFRSGYKKRTQARTIVVLSRWIRNNRYFESDFASSPELCRRLADFLSSIQARHVVPTVRRIECHLLNHPLLPKVVPALVPYHTASLVLAGAIPSSLCVRRLNSLLKSLPGDGLLSANDTSVGVAKLSLTNLHPCRLAEQVTLHEWELYRCIRFWEVVDGRNLISSSTPNLNHSKQFSNNFRNWLVYAILSHANLEDRCVLVQRVIDLLLMMEQMNNLQGSQEAKSALISAGVFRLKKTFNAVRRYKHYREVVDRLRREASTRTRPASRSQPTTAAAGTSSGGTGLPFLFGLAFSTKAHERHIKALAQQQATGDAYHPCVPFIAAGVMTRLIHLDVAGKGDMVPSGNDGSGPMLINFRKLHQLAEVVERYLAFQRLPYAFVSDPAIQDSLDKLDPLALANVSTEEEFERLMYQLSESYEPRESELVAGGDSASTSAAATGSGGGQTGATVDQTERQMSKEAIHAAAQLSSVSLKERMSAQSLHNFSLAFASPCSYGGGGNSSSSGAVASCHLSATSRIFTPPIAGSTGYGHSPPSANTATTGRLPLSSVHASAVVHQHSMSDSQVTSLPKAGVSVGGVTSSCLLPQQDGLAGHQLSPPLTPNTRDCLPPPLPPRCSQGKSSPNSTPSPRSAQLEAPPPLPPPRLPPKSGRPTRMSPKDNRARIFTFSQTDCEGACPPLPPRRLVPSSLGSGRRSDSSQRSIGAASAAAAAANGGAAGGGSPVCLSALSSAR